MDAKQKMKFYTDENLNEPFTPDQFYAKWDEYLNRKLSDRPSLKVTLSRKPEIEGTKLMLKVDSNLVNSEISSIKPDLVSWLRQELKNSSIELITEVVQQKVDSKPYSEKEKLDEMVKKNPAINQLKQIFNLDLGENM